MEIETCRLDLIQLKLSDSKIQTDHSRQETVLLPFILSFPLREIRILSFPLRALRAGGTRPARTEPKARQVSAEG